MKGWEDLGVVGTIYEDEQEEEEEEEKCDSNSISPTLSLSTSVSPSHSSSPPPPPPPTLENRVDAWSRATGSKTDVVVRLHDRCFRLHREPMISRSGYLRRLLTESSDTSVTPPSGVTAESFAEIAAVCYGSDLSVTPSGLPALLIAAEWLEINDEDDNGGVLRQMEAYLEREVVGDAETAADVLRESLKLLPAAAAACLSGRCVEVLAEANGRDGGGRDGWWIEEVMAVTAEEFGMIAESMRARAPRNDDLLYRIVDHYLENNEGQLTEEEKNRICYTVDCTRLSHHHLMHLVQNPRMPLRYVVQAMLLDQLHTRRSLFDRAITIAASTTTATAAAPRKSPPDPVQTNLTLGAILHRDAALRQAAHLRSTMDATNFRIESLERDIHGIKRRLRWSEEKRLEMDSARSASFRFFGEGRREEEEENVLADGPEVVGSKEKGCNGGARRGGGFGRRVMYGLKSVFRMSSKKSSEKSQYWRSGGEVVGVGREEWRPRHRRHRSFA